MEKIGPYRLRNNLFLAPMVGVSDTPFREICANQGAGLTIGEMLTCNSDLWQNERNRRKQIRPRIAGPQVVQIAGADPQKMAEAAVLNEQAGVDAIDINMGCPAKTVLKKAAGSALLREPGLVESILRSVVGAVSIPVTLKIRTGWCPQSRNGVEIAKLAQDCGVQLLTVHGRTRQDRFRGQAEYDTIAEIKQAVQIPLIANGDIDCPHKAAFVLRHTNADGIMVGRAAQGRPWIFREIETFLREGRLHSAPVLHEQWIVIAEHVKKLHDFYGSAKGVLFARKHVSGYVRNLPMAREYLKTFNQLDCGQAQLELLECYFDALTEQHGAIAA